MRKTSDDLNCNSFVISKQIWHNIYTSSSNEVVLTGAEEQASELGTTSGWADLRPDDNLGLLRG